MEKEPRIEEGESADEYFIDDFEEFDYVKHDKELRERAEAEADFDYFDAQYQYMDRPKFEIGRYVQDCGFDVPLIKNWADWQKALEEKSAMIRSELAQDYAGLSGLLNSRRIDDDLANLRMHNYAWNYQEPNAEWLEELDQNLLKGLHSGDLDPAAYMFLQGNYGWLAGLLRVTRDSASCGQNLYLESGDIKVSLWRYIEGTNVTIFADPNVKGRYHFGVTPSNDQDNWPAIGAYLVDSGQYEQPQTFRKHKQPFIAEPYIEIYEAIRQLTYFDTTQAPVMELQKDAKDEVHFLQYLKTGLKYDSVEPFDLPPAKNSLHLTNVRGATPPAGKEMRLFLSPPILTEGMRDQAIFYDSLYFNRLAVQIGSTRFADFVLCENYISFKDNHFDSSPICRPPLAASCAGAGEKTEDSLLDYLDGLFRLTHQLSWQNRDLSKSIPYMNIRVTANGREAVIESDWNVHEIAYRDLL